MGGVLWPGFCSHLRVLAANQSPALIRGRGISANQGAAFMAALRPRTEGGGVGAAGSAPYWEGQGRQGGRGSRTPHSQFSSTGRAGTIARSLLVKEVSPWLLVGSQPQCSATPSGLSGSPLERVYLKLYQSQRIILEFNLKLIN